MRPYSQFPAPFPNAGFGYGGGFNSRPGPDVQTDHLLGKKALHYNVADQRSERETEEGARLEMTMNNCEVTMMAHDSDRIGLAKLLKKEKVTMLPVKIGDDLDLGLVRADELATRLDLSMPQREFDRLLRLIDKVNNDNRIQPESVDDMIERMKADKSKRLKAKLQSKLSRLDNKDGAQNCRPASADGDGEQRRERQLDDPFASIAGMKVQKLEGENRLNGTIIGGRREDGNFSFTIIWDTADRAQTEHNLEEISALMAPVNEAPILQQKLEPFRTVSIATPQQARRRRVLIRRRPEDMAVDDDDDGL